MKLCKDCKHLLNTGPRETTNLWYNFICMHPEKEIISIEYVYGTKKIDHPHCRDVNTDGECPHYKNK
jgi:hypothetical protein